MRATSPSGPSGPLLHVGGGKDRADTFDRLSWN